MGKASRTKRNRLQAPTSSGSRRNLPLPWITAVVLIVLGFVFVIAISRGGDDDVGPVANQDHWHAAIGFNVCGQWVPDMPEFEVQASNANLRAGLHSHGDGLMHLHPFSSSEGGNNATVGRWLSYAGYEVDSSGFRIWTGDEFQNSDACPDGEPGQLVWSVNGEMREGDPGAYKPSDLDVVAIGFLTEGQELGTPPSAVAVANPADLANEFGQTTPASTADSSTGSTTDATAGSTPESSAPPDETSTDSTNGSDPGDSSDAEAEADS